MTSRLARLSSLIGSWVLYWLVLIGVKLGPAIAAVLSATRGSGSSVNLGFGDKGFELSVTQAGQTTYHGTVGLIALACWVAIPPLILTFAWAMARRRQIQSPERV